MRKLVSAWYLHSGRSKRSNAVVKLISLGKGPSISEAVTQEKKEPKKLRGVSGDGSVIVKRVGTYSMAKE